MRGRLAILVLAGIVVPAANVHAALRLQPTAGPGGIGIRLVDVSRNAHGDPLAHAYIVGRLAPATSITRRVEISNTTRSTAVVAVYPAAANSLRGRFGWAPGHSQNELSGWTTVRQGVLHLAPGTKAVESVTINVPADASPGERYAVIWAEVSAPGPTTGGVTAVNRVGVRMYLSTGPGGLPASNFAIGSLSAERSETGQPIVVAMVNNDGGSRLEISGSLTLAKGPDGLRAGPFPVKLGVLAPGASKPVTVRLDKRVPDGPWHARLRLASGRIERTATATLRFPARADTGRPMFRGFVAVILLVGLLGVAVLAALFFRPRGRRDDGDLHPVSSGAGSP